MTIAIDTLYRFLFTNAPVKGQLVQLPNTWRTITHTAKKHAHPERVLEILGEMTAACTLLSANLKFDGSMIMQIHGDGPVRLLVVESRADLTIRATAKIDEHATIEPDMSLQQLLNQHGRARFAITLDPNDRQPGQTPYQGIVPLEGDTMADVLMHYMRTSEQLETHIQLNANRELAAGLLLQKLPMHGGNQNSEQAGHIWEELIAIVQTLNPNELMQTAPDTLLHQLFWQHPIEHSTEQTVQFGCTCTPQKVTNMLHMTGEEEVMDMLNEDQQVEVVCDFCGQTYHFDHASIRALFESEQGNITKLH